MKSVAFYFAIFWVLVSAIIFGFTTSYIANVENLGKEGLFIVYLTLLTMVLGIFFAINYQKIALYLKNYKREKHI